MAKMMTRRAQNLVMQCQDESPMLQELARQLYNRNVDLLNQLWQHQQAGGFAGLVPVASSWRGYNIRARHWDSIGRIIEIRGYLGNVGRCCRVSFTSTAWCQKFATFEYTSPDGERVQLMSCDYNNAYNWYNFELQLEPDITDLTIKFDVRGGRQVFAVDRSKASLPWRKTKKGKLFQEVFSFPDPGAKGMNFELGGTWMHVWIASATADDGELLCGGPDPPEPEL